MLSLMDWRHGEERTLTSSRDSEIQFQAQWVYDHLTFKTFVNLSLNFPDGTRSTVERSHKHQTTEEHYEQLRQWLKELIAEWKNKPYALVEPVDVQDVHDD